MAVALTLGVVLTAGILIAAGAPAPVRLFVWPLAWAAAVTWLQVIRRFCVAFGALGLENFGGLGRQVPVDPSHRAEDRRRAFQLIGLGGLIGLVAALAVVAIPV